MDNEGYLQVGLLGTIGLLNTSAFFIVLIVAGLVGTNWKVLLFPGGKSK